MYAKVVKNKERNADGARAMLKLIDYFLRLWMVKSLFAAVRSQA